MMKRHPRILFVLFSVFLLLSIGSGATAGTPGGSGRLRGSFHLDRTLPVDPYLQYGAQVEPDRRVRVIVQKTGPQVDSHAIARAAGAAPMEEFPLIDGLVLEVPLRAVMNLARQPGVRYISYDTPLRLTEVNTANLKTTHQELLGLPSIWNAGVPATGMGVIVAVLDSGVNANHADLRTNVESVVVNKKATGARDQNGHGTHVTGIIQGRDSLGRYIGVAPGAHVISVQIADDQGKSMAADLLRGLQWVYDNRLAYNIRVVNLSVNAGTAGSYQTSPISAAVEQLWFNGVVVVVAAGNRGSQADATWYPPANDPYVVTVGALDHNLTASPGDDSLASFSSRGQTQDGHYKPEIVAPGRKIYAPLASNSATLAQQFPGSIQDSVYIRLSGTSMAAPVVSGVVALLLERYPDLTPDEVKWLLTHTAKAYPGQADGAGLVDPVALLAAAGGPVGRANAGNVPNAGTDQSTSSVEWSSAYWDAAFWDAAYWDSATYECIDDE